MNLNEELLKLNSENRHLRKQLIESQHNLEELAHEVTYLEEKLMEREAEVNSLKLHIVALKSSIPADSLDKSSTSAEEEDMRSVYEKVVSQAIEELGSIRASCLELREENAQLRLSQRFEGGQLQLRGTPHQGEKPEDVEIANLRSLCQRLNRNLVNARNRAREQAELFAGEFDAAVAVVGKELYLIRQQLARCEEENLLLRQRQHMNVNETSLDTIQNPSLLEDMGQSHFVGDVTSSPTTLRLMEEVERIEEILALECPSLPIHSQKMESSQ